MKDVSFSDDVLEPFISVLDSGDATIVTSGGFGQTWCKDVIGLDELKTVPDLLEPIRDVDITYIDEEITDDDTTQPYIDELFVSLR